MPLLRHHAAPRRRPSPSPGSVIAGALITSPIGVASGRGCGSTTRPMTSCRVKMPSGRPSASTTGSEPMRCALPSSSALRSSGVVGDRRSPASLPHAGRPSGVAMSALRGDAGQRTRPARAAREQVEQVARAVRVQKSLKRRRSARSARRTSPRGNTRQNVSCGRAVDDCRRRACASSAPSGNISPAPKLATTRPSTPSARALAADRALLDHVAMRRTIGSRARIVSPGAK